MARSVVIFPAALMYQKGRFGIQLPGRSTRQNFATGLQLNTTMRI